MSLNEDMWGNTTKTRIDHGDSKSETKAGGSKGSKQDTALITIIYALEFIMFSCMLVAAYFLRFQKDMFKTFYTALQSCDDPRYSYGYLPYNITVTHVNISLSINSFYCIFLLLPIAVVCLGELAYFYLSDKRSKTIILRSLPFKIHMTPRRICRILFSFYIGIFITSVLTDSIKMVSGRPRPHFFDLCEPDTSSEACSKITNSSEQICTAIASDELHDARMSFPSAFASLGMYAGVFLAYYLNIVIKMNAVYSLRPFMVFSFLIFGFLPSFTRYQLNYNHWEDLLAGYLIGAVVAIYMGRVMLNSFQELHLKPSPVQYNIIQETQKVGSPTSESFELQPARKQQVDDQDEDGYIRDYFSSKPSSAVTQNVRSFTGLPTVILNPPQAVNPHNKSAKGAPVPPPLPAPPLIRSVSQLY